MNFAGTYVEDEPSFKIIFSFKDKNNFKNQKKLAQIVKNFDWSKHVFFKKVKYSLRNLQEISSEVTDILDANKNDEYIVSTDIRSNMVLAEVKPSVKYNGSNMQKATGANSIPLLPEGSVLYLSDKIPSLTAVWGGDN